MIRLRPFGLLLTALLLAHSRPALAQGQVYSMGGMKVIEDSGHLVIDPSALRGAKSYNYSQILAQTLQEAAANPKAGAEVMTYLRNPAAWQQGLIRNHGLEMGLPVSRVILANGTIIRTYAVPPIPAGTTRVHRFTDPPQPGWTMYEIWDLPSFFYEVRFPPNVAQPQVIPQAAGPNKVQVSTPAAASRAQAMKLPTPHPASPTAHARISAVLPGSGFRPRR